MKLSKTRMLKIREKYIPILSTRCVCSGSNIRHLVITMTGVTQPSIGRIEALKKELALCK